MGILLDDDLGIRDLYIVQHLERMLMSLLLVHPLVDHEGLAELLVHTENGVQGGHRFLEDDGDLVAADVVHLLDGELGKILSVQEDLAAVDVSVAVQQLQDTHGRNGLAGAGLTDDADGLARFQRIGHAVDRFDDALLGPKECVQIFYFK